MSTIAAAQNAPISVDNIKTLLLALCACALLWLAFTMFFGARKGDAKRDAARVGSALLGLIPLGLAGLVALQALGVNVVGWLIPGAK